MTTMVTSIDIDATAVVGPLRDERVQMYGGGVQLTLDTEEAGTLHVDLDPDGTLALIRSLNTYLQSSYSRYEELSADA